MREHVSHRKPQVMELKPQRIVLLVMAINNIWALSLFLCLFSQPLCQTIENAGPCFPLQHFPHGTDNHLGLFLPYDSEYIWLLMVNVKQMIKNHGDMSELIDIYRAFHPKRAEYTLFSSAHGTLSKTDHIWGHESSLGKFKKTEIISSIFSSHNAMILEINYREKL